MMTNKKTKTRKQTTTIEKKVMAEIISGEVKMKPGWYFVIGSVLMVIGLISATIAAIFLTNLTFFLINKRGVGYGKLSLLLESIPIWVPILAILGVVLGIYLLKKYDFSYKKNFVGIIIAFVASVIIAGLLVNQLGLNNIWSHQGPMRGFYMRIERQNNHPPSSFGGKRQIKELR